MEKCRKKRVALLLLPITIFLVLISVSYAIDILATVKVIFGGLNITITEPRNITHLTSTNHKNLYLTFTIDKMRYWITHNTKHWMFYSIDGSPLIELKSTIDIIGVPPGIHKLVVYANDTLGNSGSAVVYFTVKKKLCMSLFSIKALEICF